MRRERSAAVVGVGCVLPDAFDVEAFWRNTLAGHRALRELSDGPWDWARHYDPTGRDPERFHSMTAARVAGWSFDWRKFRIPPKDVEAINPFQLMVLDAGAQAIESVRVVPKARTGIFLGSTGLGWQRDSGLRIRLEGILEAIASAPSMRDLDEASRGRVIGQLRARVDETLGPVSEDNVVNAAASVAAGRIATHFDLRGLHYAVDAGFASGLASLEIGLGALRDGTLDMVLVGGVSELLSPLELVAFSRLGGLARGDVRPFDARAEGTLLGEGTAVLALKRLEDALRDEEQILAVVAGVGGSSDGRTRSLLAPDAAGQALAMQRAYEDAGVDPRTVAHCECHATGTPVGDASELEALASVIGTGPAVTVTSAKSAIGHLRAGAGSVGLLRAVLALHHGVVPRQIAFDAPSAALRDTGFQVPTEIRELRARGGEDLHAAVSAFGFGGTNYHAVLTAHDPPRRATANKALSASSSGPGRRGSADRPAPRAEGIAVVGMAGVFPGADSTESFWASLLSGFDATRDVPADRWDVGRYWAEDRSKLDKSYTRLGCFLDALPELGSTLGIPPSAAESLDPSHLLCLQVAHDALADAGIDPATWEARDRVSVMLAFLPYQGKKFLADARINSREIFDELKRVLRANDAPEALVTELTEEAERAYKKDLPAITEDTLTGYLGSLNAGRVARRYGLRGSHFVVDAACASAHAAVHAAVQALRQGRADTVLTGGVWCDMQPEFFVAACRFDALSSSGSTPFDEGADGFIPGEGAGVLVLRRLSDAQRDGQRIHAVLRAVGGSTDGKGSSILAPTVAGELGAMQHALAEAGVDPADVGYVECHGTGTALGDVVEAEACEAAYGAGRDTPLRIGSVKSNIGHLNAAAGVPGIIKAIYAVREGLIPPSLKVERRNPKITAFARGTLEVVRATTRWERPASDIRRAGVSAFGVGGANMHILLEEYLPSPRVSAGSTFEARDRHLIARVAAADPVGCVAALRALAADVARRGLDAALEPRGEGAWRGAVVARSPEELSERVSLLQRVDPSSGGAAALRQRGVYLGQANAPLVVTFPGQGPQYPNMVRALAEAHHEVAATLDEADEAYARICGRALRPSFWTDDPDRWEQSDEDIHCAVLAVNVALYRWVRARGARPSALIGQSAGELAALVAAGSLELADALFASYERTRAVLSLRTDDPGAMLAIQAGRERVEPLLRGLTGYAALAADNAPSACIVSGERIALRALTEQLRGEGVEVRRLDVSHGYHSRMIEGAVPAYRAALGSLRFRPPEVTIHSTISGEVLPRDRPSSYAAHLCRQLVEPVRLRDAVEGAWAAGGRLFVECGPKWSLTAFTDATLEPREHFTQAIIHPKVGELELAARAHACLFVHGHDGDWPSTRARPPHETGRAEAPSPGLASSPTAEALGAMATLVGVHGDPPDEGSLLRVLEQIRALIDQVIPRESEERRHPAIEAVSDHAAPRSRSAESSTETSAPGPTPAIEARPAEPVTLRADPEDVLARLVAVLCERTGYPAEMLEPDLNLEADLGIDSIKQMASLSLVRQDLGLRPDPAFSLRDHGTLRGLATYLSGRLPATESPPPTQHDVATHSPLPTESPPPRRDLEVPATLGAARSVDPSPAPTADISALRDRVRLQLVAELAERTGYPEEMLEADLDLEAELGIDTVKQIAIVTKVRETLELAPDSEFTLRDHRTIRQLTDYLVKRLGGPISTRASRRSARPSRRGERSREARVQPRHDVLRLLRAHFANRTGYPAEMLEEDLELEADLGIDTVKQVAVLTKVREELGLDSDGEFNLRAHRSLASLEAYFDARLGSDAPARSSMPPAPPSVIPPGTRLTTHGSFSFAERAVESVLAPHDESVRVVGDAALLELAIAATGVNGETALHLSDLRWGAAPVLSATGPLELHVERANTPDGVRVVVRSDVYGEHFGLLAGGAGGALRPLGPSLAARLSEPGEDARLIARELGRPPPDVQSAWARSLGFDRLVAGLRCHGPAAESGAKVVDFALWCCSAAWMAAYGSAHTLRAVGALSLESCKGDTELRFVVRLGSRTEGRACAEVDIYTEAGHPVGNLVNVEGTATGPLARDVAAGGELLLRWQHLCRRLDGDLLPGEDAGW